MSFISKMIIPIIEKELLSSTPDIANYLVANAANIGKDFVQFLESKIQGVNNDKEIHSKCN